MSKRADFSSDVAAVKATTDSEVASLLKLVGHESGGALPSATPRSDNDPKPLASPETRPVKLKGDVRPVAPEVTIRPPTKPKSSPKADEEMVLQNVTTRLTRETNELLTEAALRQKLAKRKPDTRQDIMEVALIAWFKAIGYG